ncbi:MAG TPA: DpnI domain-containing protein [Alloacidobacterium sp.]|jgi:type II restriction enzyme|nr:DpnI domain-containing protein [Alloacidobacterium sp.]
MELFCDLSIAARYKSKGQIARVLSEAWWAANGYCLVCTSDSLKQSKANTRCTDFICSGCKHSYELKALRRWPAAKVSDGAYAAMMSRIHEGTTPSLLLLERSENWHIRSLTAIHSTFLTPIAIEKRKPLSGNAVRAGWTGCNILLDKIGQDGQIPVIQEGAFLPKEEVRQRFRMFMPLAEKSAEERGWTALTLTVLRGLGKPSFLLKDVYEKEQIFSNSYPQNRHIRDKIRQQLQVLRDMKIIRFDGRGHYSFL